MVSRKPSNAINAPEAFFAEVDNVQLPELVYLNPSLLQEEKQVLFVHPICQDKAPGSPTKQSIRICGLKRWAFATIWAISLLAIAGAIVGGVLSQRKIESTASPAEQSPIGSPYISVITNISSFTALQYKSDKKYYRLYFGSPGLSDQQTAISEARLDNSDTRASTWSVSNITPVEPYFIPSNSHLVGYHSNKQDNGLLNDYFELYSVAANGLVQGIATRPEHDGDWIRASVTNENYISVNGSTIVMQRTKAKHRLLISQGVQGLYVANWSRSGWQNYTLPETNALQGSSLAAALHNDEAGTIRLFYSQPGENGVSEMNCLTWDEISSNNTDGWQKVSLNIPISPESPLGAIPNQATGNIDVVFPFTTNTDMPNLRVVSIKTDGSTYTQEYDTPSTYGLAKKYTASSATEDGQLFVLFSDDLGSGIEWWSRTGVDEWSFKEWVDFE